MTHSTAPSEKNQNSSPAQSRCVTVARAKTVKNVWVKIAQSGRRKIAMTNFSQRVGIVHGSRPVWRRIVGTAYEATFLRCQSYPQITQIDADEERKAEAVIPSEVEGPRRTACDTSTGSLDFARDD